MRIFEPEFEGDHHAVVFSEMEDNTGQSITNAIEQVASEVMLANALPTMATVVIEHYPAVAHPPEDALAAKLAHSPGDVEGDGGEDALASGSLELSLARRELSL